MALDIDPAAPTETVETMFLLFKDAHYELFWQKI